jgi:glycerol-3-phosphate dehydrogenase
MTERQTYDLLIVGGRINGAGIARDAAGPEGVAVRAARPGRPYLLRQHQVHSRWRAAPHIIWPLRFVLPRQAEAILQEEKADIVALGRALLADRSRV